VEEAGVAVEAGVIQVVVDSEGLGAGTSAVVELGEAGEKQLRRGRGTKGTTELTSHTNSKSEGLGTGDVRPGRALGNNEGETSLWASWLGWE